MSSPVGLVVAKAPVPGQVKTRLAASVGDSAAAHLAAAALLDTLSACEAAFQRCYLALAGDLDEGVEAGALSKQCREWRILPQRGTGLAERLGNAYRDVGVAACSGVVQIGMDTPQVQSTCLADIGEALATHPAILGLAEDGGWWVLGLRDPRAGSALADVPMSMSATGSLTRTALERQGIEVTSTVRLRDVDTFEDAAAVATSAPATRFAAVWETVQCISMAAR